MHKDERPCFAFVLPCVGNGIGGAVHFRTAELRAGQREAARDRVSQFARRRLCPGTRLHIEIGDGRAKTFGEKIAGPRRHGQRRIRAEALAR